MTKAIITDDLNKYKVYDIDTAMTSYKDYYATKKDCEKLINYLKDVPVKSEEKREVILAIIGPSAAGKDTLARELSERLDCKSLVSDTTRPRRKGEIDGVDYNFLTKVEFLDKIDNKEYLEWTNFKGWFYGTPKSQVKDNISIGVFNLEGLARLHKCTGYEIIPIYLNDSFLTRLKRSVNRENKIKIEYFRRGFVDAMSFTWAPNYLKSCYTKYIDMSENDWTIEQMADRVIFMLRRWAILDN